MEKIILAANWKSNKTVDETKVWLQEFAGILKPHADRIAAEAEVIVCAPYTNLYVINEFRKESGLPFSIGAQDVSPFPEGAYTGEESARMIKALAEWVIIGHSERRSYQGEEEYELFNEVYRARDAGLKVIYCISEPDMKVPADVEIVAYEPLWAIGTGKTDTPENADKVAHEVATKSGIPTVLYGGSVTADNVRTFVTQPHVSGVLVGGASLKPESFLKLITSALE